MAKAKIKKIRGYQLALKCDMGWSEFQQKAAACGINMASAQNSMEEPAAMDLMARVQASHQSAPPKAPPAPKNVAKTPPQTPQSTAVFQPIPLRRPDKHPQNRRNARGFQHAQQMTRGFQKPQMAPPPSRRLQLRQHR